ncbi:MULTISPECIES: acyl-CoA dehydrogenase family protein [Bradyrhizobium]|uniref:acyl-CoA dehydrogenase family protein n=1 Tax=Bradyrhizobium brasilense TaxID=1419277 RepID=UPI003530D048
MRSSPLVASSRSHSERSGRRSCRAASRGTEGYVKGTGIERFYRDVRAFRIYEGTSQIHLLNIAKRLLSDQARPTDLAQASGVERRNGIGRQAPDRGGVLPMVQLTSGAGEVGNRFTVGSVENTRRQLCLQF